LIIVDTGAWELFRASQKRSWSFTDCTSFALMKELRLSETFAFDKHFEEAGLNPRP
jgi:predicted nucleic acid-binding protein